MNEGRGELPSARLDAPASRSSFTKRSCNVLCARSTRPFAWLELAQMMSMLSTSSARPNWVMPSPPIAVEDHRFAPGLQIGPGRMEIRERRLALDELQMHQPAGGVVDEHQQRALRPAILKPPMLAAVDLNPDSPDGSGRQDRRLRKCWANCQFLLSPVRSV